MPAKQPKKAEETKPAPEAPQKAFDEAKVLSWLESYLGGKLQASGEGGALELPELLKNVDRDAVERKKDRKEKVVDALGKTKDVAGDLARKTRIARFLRSVGVIKEKGDGMSVMANTDAASEANSGAGVDAALNANANRSGNVGTVIKGDAAVVDQPGSGQMQASGSAAQNAEFARQFASVLGHRGVAPTGGQSVPIKGLALGLKTHVNPEESKLSSVKQANIVQRITSFMRRPAHLRAAQGAEDEVTRLAKILSDQESHLVAQTTLRETNRTLAEQATQALGNARREQSSMARLTREADSLVDSAIGQGRRYGDTAPLEQAAQAAQEGWLAQRPLVEQAKHQMDALRAQLATDTKTIQSLNTKIQDTRNQLGQAEQALTSAVDTVKGTTSPLDVVGGLLPFAGLGYGAYRLHKAGAASESPFTRVMLKKFAQQGFPVDPSMTAGDKALAAGAMASGGLLGKGLSESLARVRAERAMGPVAELMHGAAAGDVAASEALAGELRSLGLKGPRALTSAGQAEGAAENLLGVLRKAYRSRSLPVLMGGGALAGLGTLAAFNKSKMPDRPPVPQGYPEQYYAQQHLGHM
ncbi:hypothetical protein CMI47_20300 [Candidatus Pacearchaeota archaeon]|nr:hypothetical protein [Candidatus Pacearchaeota archaeon]|tara:strand:- start:5101 stop:6855 length:1755 start_codon:yes stop_codon:yes gene_type:complete